MANILEHQNNVTGPPSFVTDTALFLTPETAITIYLHGALGMAIILTNTLVLVAHFNNKNKRHKNVDIYVFYLAIADFLVGLIIMLLFSVWGMLSFPVIPLMVCHIWSILKQFSISFSVLIMILLSYDRLELVINPLKYHRKQNPARIHCLVFVAGSLCFFYCTIIYIMSFFFIVQEDQVGINIYSCIPELTTNGLYHMILTVCNFCIPFSIVSVINVIFYWKLVQNMEVMSKIQQKERDYRRYLCSHQHGNSLPNSHEQCYDGKGNFAREEFDRQLVFSEDNTGTKPDKAVVMLGDVEENAHKECWTQNVKESVVASSQSQQKSNSGGNNSIVLNPFGGEERDKDDKRPCHKQQYDVFEVARKRKHAQLRRIAKRLAIYVGVFLLCWLPFEMSSFLLSCGVAVPLFVMYITGLILLSNSVLNPLIYALFSRNSNRN